MWAVPGGLRVVDEAVTTVLGGLGGAMRWMYPWKKAVVPSGGSVKVMGE
jgi:hypothetical protein